MILKNKRIILGITASIAAYKSISLVRSLVKKGAKVQVITTPESHNFVTPLTLSTVSNRSVYTKAFDKISGKWLNHANLSINTDVILIAPASVNTIAKMATGICDNLLLLTYLSARCPVIIAPAMDLDMNKHPTLLQNLKKLKSFGNIIIEPTAGNLASGLVGKGRMEEPENIIKFLHNYFTNSNSLKNKKFLVTAGPTCEKIDQVRYISNFSSGKMGYAIAEELASCGAKINLISGPTNLQISHSNINKTDVISAEDMHKESVDVFDECDGAILVAAVSDFKTPNCKKTKKKNAIQLPHLKLVHTKDIAKSIGKIKANKLLVGFALETSNEEANAKEKLHRKNFDFIVLNSLNDKGAGFIHDTNKVSIIHKNGKINKFPIKSKKEVARDIVQEVINFYYNGQG